MNHTSWDTLGRSALLTALVAVLVVGSSGGSAAAAEPTVDIADGTVSPEATTTVNLVLTEVPDGLAGFEVTVGFETDGVATVADARYPELYGLTSEPTVEADGQQVTVEAVDIEDEIEPGATDVSLATITVTGVDTGSTALSVTEAQIDADGGEQIEGAIDPGLLTVEPSADAQSAGGDSQPSDGNGQSSDSDGSMETDPANRDTIPTVTIAVILGTIAVVGAVLIARRD